MYRCDRSYTEPSYIWPRYTLADSSMIYYTSLRDRIFILGDFFLPLAIYLSSILLLSYRTMSVRDSDLLNCLEFFQFPISLIQSIRER